MKGADVLLTIAEVSVAFAGFASVVVLFQHRDLQRWPEAIVVRLRTMIEASLGALFAALVPFVLHHQGLSGAALWSAASALLAIGLAAETVAVRLRSRRALAAGELSRPFATTVAGVTVLVVLALALNALGLGLDRSFGPYLVGVTWALFFAGLMFLRVVVFPSPPSDAD